MSKFKVGDKVRALVETPWWRKGDMGIIKRIDDGFRVDFEGEDGEMWWFCYAEEGEFELVDASDEIFDALAALKKDMLLGISGDSVTTYPNPPHKHQIEIIAWANGADIESPVGDAWYSFKYPSWDDTLEYRIKQTKTPLQIEIEKCEAKLVKLKGQL